MSSVTIFWRKRKGYHAGYLIIRSKGEKIWEPMGLKLTNNERANKSIFEAAELIRAKRMIELAQSDYELPVNTNKNFLTYYKSVIDKNPEYERRAAVYKHLKDFIGKRELSFRDINERFWDEFKTYLVNERKHGQYTIHTVLSILKAVINKAVKERVINKNPLQHVTEKRPKGTRQYLTYEELVALTETSCGDDRIKNAFLFVAYTGLRKSDLAELRVKNLINNEINFVIKKTKIEISVPIPEAARKFLPDCTSLLENDKLFPLPAWSTVSVLLKAWAKAAGIKKNVTPHVFRHTYATLLLTYGTSIEVVRDLLGHSDIRETQIYAKIIDPLKRKAADNLPKI